MNQEPRSHGRRGWFLFAAVGLVVAAALILPLASSDDEDDPATTTTTTQPGALADVPPFGKRLPGALAYLSEDRIFNLVHLGTGDLIGSKGVAGNRRPAAASAERAYLGSLPGAANQANWDDFRSLPWAGTEYRDHARGVSVAYSADLDVVAAAMRPLPDGGNGVFMAGTDQSWIAAASDGWWAWTTWVGDQVLVRELSGTETRWWLIDGNGPAPPQRIDLPADFQPITGREGYVMGRLGESGVIIDLATGQITRLSGRFSWAAAWQPGPNPQLTTVGGQDPPAVISYTTAGTFAWSAPLREPVTRFNGGVAWSPDGSFVMVATDGTLEAYTEQGGTIGRLGVSFPDPQDDMAFLTVVPAPAG